MPYGSSSVTLCAVGDTLLGSDWPTPLLPPHDLLQSAAPLLRRADLAFGNLEGVLADGGTVRKEKADPTRSYAFRTPSRYGAWLAAAGFDVLSVANNHSGDFGPAGRQATIANLRRLRISPVGAPDCLAVTRTVRGLPITFVAFATGGIAPNLNHLSAATVLVRRSVGMGPLVVSFHGGAEGAAYQHVPRGPETYRGEARGDLRRFAHAVIDAGADLVLGHGPHVLRGLEVYRGRLIAYSLGNFATYGRISVRGAAGITCVLEAGLGRDGRFAGGRIHPFVQRGEGGPRPDPHGQAIAQLRRLSAADFGKSAPKIAPDGMIAP